MVAGMKGGVSRTLLPQNIHNHQDMWRTYLQRRREPVQRERKQPYGEGRCRNFDRVGDGLDNSAYYDDLKRSVMC